MCLMQWLGPWKSDAALPDDVERAHVRCDSTPSFDMLFYRRIRRAPKGALLLLPGLHPKGPFDPRLDRFARILASAGFVVASPLLPDFKNLRVNPNVIKDAELSFLTMLTHPWMVDDVRAVVFGLSVGSLPAIALCASSKRKNDIRGLVTFGGHADWEAAVKHSLWGSPGIQPDPLNRPAIFINLVDALDVTKNDASLLVNKWLDFIHATWGNDKLSDRQSQIEIAQSLVTTIPEHLRVLFMQGAVEGGDPMALRALSSLRDRFSCMDPQPWASAVHCPTLVAHGKADNIVPVAHAQQLTQMFHPATDAKIATTGLWTHSKTTSMQGRTITAAREAAALGSIIWTLATHLEAE